MPEQNAERSMEAQGDIQTVSAGEERTMSAYNYCALPLAVHWRGRGNWSGCRNSWRNPDAGRRSGPDDVVVPGSAGS